jgi:ParB/RepB/Spo0J family partition protein
MRDDGLKVPIEVVEGHGCYFVRAGFRRRKVAAKLGWKKIPAIVWPADTPQRDEYWINILENATRKALTTFETAHAAKLMRDKFGVTAAEFSRKAGYSESYVSKLLTCMDKLPEMLIEQWKIGAGLSFDEWYHLALMEPENAVKRFWSLTGQRPKDIMRGLVEYGKNGKKMPPAWMSDRMMKLYEGIEGGELEPRVRDLVLRAIEVCMGTRDIIKGVYEPRRQGEYARRARLRAELKLPELGDDSEAENKPPEHLDSDEDGGLRLTRD